MMPPVEFLSEDDFYALLEVPFNPVLNPSPDLSEHEGPHRQMKDALFKLGGGQCWGPHSYEAFSAMEDCWTPARYIGACLGSPKFVRPDLFQRLHDIVASLEEDYLMHISTDFIEVSDFDLLITRHQFRAWMRNRKELPLFHRPTG